MVKHCVERRLRTLLTLLLLDILSYYWPTITLDIVKNDDEDNDLRQNCTRLNYYGLKKVADLLHLDFDRTRSAKRIYTELKNKGLVEIERKGDIEYICLTDKGREKCERKIEETRKLMKYFRSIPALQIKYNDQVPQVPSGMVLKGGRPTMDHTAESYVELLIKKISDWQK